MSLSARDERRHGSPSTRGMSDVGDRTEAQRDRDRILYTSAFRRLAGVTQVASAAEGHVFHNRLTHTLEVAQVARRLAERLSARHVDLLTRTGAQLSPDVAEAAALAHDLGHPPFGHIAEKELDSCVRESRALRVPPGDPSAANKREEALGQDGYEGNAQSFRILTRLAAHPGSAEGLNLTRATLNAVLKYPWFKTPGEGKKAKKYGAYQSETADFEFARSGYSEDERSIEAQIMDHADAVAYSVHDLDDFYRAGLIRLEAIPGEFEHHLKSFRKANDADVTRVDAHADELRKWVTSGPVSNLPRYTGYHYERATVRGVTSGLIRDFIAEVTLQDVDGVVSLNVPPFRWVQMKFLQHLVWTQVIETPRLASQQRGQRKIIRALYDEYLGAILGGEYVVVPAVFRTEAKQLGEEVDPRLRAPKAERLAADIVASFTDAQASTLFRRLTGISGGSVTDLVDS